ncbi:MAG: DUF5674 family protein [Candidatus Zixiibacteriota bacterium]
MIHLIREPATPQQITEMLEALDTYIKLAVDIEREVLAGGGILHSDCETVLLEDGSRQEDIWGVDWISSPQAEGHISGGKVRFEALINIRPKQKNFTMEIQNPKIRDRVEAIVRRLLAGMQ